MNIEPKLQAIEQEYIETGEKLADPRKSFKFWAKNARSLNLS